MQQESEADRHGASAMAQVARVMEVNGLLQAVPTMGDGPLKTQLLARLTTLMAAAPTPANAMIATASTPQPDEDSPQI